MQNLNHKTLIIIAVLLVGFGVVLRFLPHPANMTPLTAIALFAGVYFRGKWVVLVPVLAMVISDIFLGWHNLVLFTWGSFAAVVAIGLWVRKTKSVGRIALGAVSGSVLFFLVTNWAVWALTPMYAKTLDGLMTSYVMGLPFFRNMVVGDLLYVGALFGVMELALLVARKRAKRASAPIVG